MTQFFYDLGLFTSKGLILAALIAVVIALVVSLVSRQTHAAHDQLSVTKLGERLRHERETLEGALMDDVTYIAANKERHAREKADRKAQKKALKAARRAGQPPTTLAPPADGKKRVFVVDFDGDLQASAVSNLRRELTAILSVATSKDEVVVRLESGGGLVHAYGLAASQLERVKTQGVPLTVCVDKVAASGGYMMACVANTIVAAPFAVVGSIGVVAQVPNFHRLLKKHDIDVELVTAGKYKRTLTVLGENTEEGRAKFREDLDETHALFRTFVGKHRPSVDIEKVSTGEVWFGSRAVDEHLVDEIRTSDDYLVKACAAAEVVEVKFKARKSIQDRLTSSFETAIEGALTRLYDRALRRPLS